MGEKYENIEENSVVVKIEEDLYAKVNKKSDYIGVCYYENKSRWRAQRWSKTKKTSISSGYYLEEETAAHATDTLARKLMKNGEQNHKLNFPDDYTVVHWETKNTNKYIGVAYHKNRLKWMAQRWSKNENDMLYNGYYSDEEKAAHASDTLARKLMKNGKQNLKLNFLHDYTEVYPEKKKHPRCFGVTYDKGKWKVQRWSRHENKVLYNGYHDDKERAALASDTLARTLMKNGNKDTSSISLTNKLNFTQRKIKRKENDQRTETYDIIKAIERTNSGQQ